LIKLITTRLSFFLGHGYNGAVNVDKGISGEVVTNYPNKE